MIFTKKTFMSWVLLLFMSLNAYASSEKWQVIAPGLDYIKLSPSFASDGLVHAFRIDLTNYRLDLAFASDQRMLAAQVRDLVQENHAILGVNGGFFNTKFKPLGLRIKNGMLKSPLKFISWWHIFLISNNEPKISRVKEFLVNDNTTFAVQSGPRLLANGNILRLKPGAAERTALGITKSNKVILLATENLMITTTQLATIMLQLDCTDALNLDGGHSTQIFAKINDLNLEVAGFSPVVEAIIVVPRERPLLSW